MEQAALIHNICPRHGDDVIPYELIYKRSFDYRTLRAAGCKTYYLVPENKLRSKLSERAVPAMYLQRDCEREGDVLYVPSLHIITTSFHHVFSECEYLTKDDLSGAERFKIPVNTRRTRQVAPDDEQRNEPRRVRFENNDDANRHMDDTDGIHTETARTDHERVECQPCDDTNTTNLPYDIPIMDYVMCPNYPRCNQETN